MLKHALWADQHSTTPFPPATLGTYRPTGFGFPGGVMTDAPWSARLEPERVQALRLLVAMQPENFARHVTSRGAYFALARTLLDMSDVAEGAITAVVAAALAVSDIADTEPVETQSTALDEVLAAHLSPQHVQAILAGAAVRSHETLNEMERVGTGPDGYHPAQIDRQRRNAAMSLQAFHAWEILM